MQVKEAWTMEMTSYELTNESTNKTTVLCRYTLAQKSNEKNYETNNWTYVKT